PPPPPAFAGALGAPRSRFLAAIARFDEPNFSGSGFSFSSRSAFLPDFSTFGDLPDLSGFVFSVFSAFGGAPSSVVPFGLNGTSCRGGGKGEVGGGGGAIGHGASGGGVQGGAAVGDGEPPGSGI